MKPTSSAEVSVTEDQSSAEVGLTVRPETWNDLVVEIVDQAGQPLPGVTVQSGGFGGSGNAPTGETDAAAVEITSVKSNFVTGRRYARMSVGVTEENGHAGGGFRPGDEAVVAACCGALLNGCGTPGFRDVETLESLVDFFVLGHL